MMRIKIIAVGKLKESYWREAQNEYMKRLGSFCTPSVAEVAEERLPDNPSAAEIKKGLLAEAARIAKEIPNGACVIPMCIEGKETKSEELADFIAHSSVEGVSTIAFIIGSSFGLDEHLKANGKMRISLSKMTFPHQFARVMLLEQIYRAFSINNHNKYHK